MNEQHAINPFEPPADEAAAIDADLDRQGPPWEMPGPLTTRFYRTVVGILWSPQRSFAEMRLKGRVQQARGFAVVGMTAGLAFHQLYSVVYSAAWPMFLGETNKPSTDLTGPVATAICMLLLAPIFALVALYAGAGLLHVSLNAVGSARASFETTFRVVAYSLGAASVWLVVPVIGPLLAAQGIYIQIVGIAQTQRISNDRSVASAIVFSLIVFFLIFLCVVAYLMIVYLEG